jgi:hypothetical protein
LLDDADALGLMVVTAFPLTGEIGRLLPEDLAAAGAGVAGEQHNHPCSLGYCPGLDLGAAADTAARLEQLDAAVSAVDPDGLWLEGLTSGPDAASWRWRTLGAAPRAGFTRLVRTLRPSATAPAEAPAPDPTTSDDAATPSASNVAWPFLAFWREHGGDEGDLRAADDAFGPAPSDDDVADRLSWLHADATRRALAAVAASGAGLCIDALNESWPRVGGALVDYTGGTRPALDLVRRFRRGPSLWADADTNALAPGDVARVALYLRPGDDWPAGARISSRLIGLDGVARQEAAVTVPPGPISPVTSITWRPPDGTPPGVYLAVDELPGAEPDIAPLILGATSAAPLLTVRWLADGQPRLPGIQAQKEDAPVIYLGPGATGVDEEALAAAVRAGAGLVLDGLPELSDNSPLAAALPAKPVFSNDTRLVSVARPEVLAADHPALLGLGGALPDAWSDGFADLAPDAEPLIRYGAGRPLLVEGHLGQGRVLLLLTPPDYHHRLTAWDGWPRLLTGLLAYAAKLSYGDTRRLLAKRDDRPLAPLAQQPAARLTLDAGGGDPLTVAPGEPGTRTIRLRNEGQTLLPLVTLRLAGAADDLTARLTPSSCCLRPGETRNLDLTVEAWRPMSRKGTLRITAGGLSVQSAAAEVHYEAGH